MILPRLRDEVGAFTVNGASDEVFPQVVEALRGLRMEVQEQDPIQGFVQVKCLCMAANWLIWSCWADHLFLVISTPSPTTTAVTVYVLPNLLRRTKKPGEVVVDIPDLVDALNGALQPRAKPLP